MKPGVALLAALTLGAAAVTQAGHPDLTGVWAIVSHPAVLKAVDGTAPPLNPAATAVYAQHRAAAARGDRSFDGVTRCLPPGLPRLLLMNTPFEILQRDKAVYFVHELNRLPRRAYFDEQLPGEVDPLYLGYSVAHWEGDALVIDSAGFLDSTLLDDSGLPHSDALRLTERYRLSHDGRHLTARFTIEDPQTFTRRWTAQAEYVKEPGYELREDVCADKQAASASKP